MVLLHQGHDNVEFMFMFVNCHINPLTCNSQLGENKIRVCSQQYLSCVTRERFIIFEPVPLRPF